MLLTQRDQWQRLIAPTRRCMGTAVEELLRFESPLQLNNRRPPRRCASGGVALPAGSFVTWASAAANRDPAEFERP